MIDYLGNKASSKPGRWRFEASGVRHCALATIFARNSSPKSTWLEKKGRGCQKSRSNSVLRDYFGVWDTLHLHVGFGHWTQIDLSVAYFHQRGIGCSTVGNSQKKRKTKRAQTTFKASKKQFVHLNIV